MELSNKTNSEQFGEPTVYAGNEENVSFLAETVWIEATQTLQIIARAEDINKIKSNGSLNLKQVSTDGGKEIVLNERLLKEKAKEPLLNPAEAGNAEKVSFYSKFTWTDSSKTLKISAPKVNIEQINSNGHLKLEYFVADGEEKKLFKRYEHPQNPKKTAKQLCSALEILPLSRQENAWQLLFAFIETRIKDFLPTFLKWLAEKARFEDLVVVHQHKLLRQLELVNNVSTESYYYQNRVGKYWYWYFREKDEEGKFKNHSRGRCKGLELPKYNGETVDPTKYRIIFSDDYLIEEVRGV